MTRVFNDDNRGASNVLGSIFLVGIIIVSLTVAGAVATDRIETEIRPDTEISESKIDATTQQQLRITPLVGDDINLNETEVRVTFPDRKAPPAVVTDVGAAKAGSQSIRAVDNTTIKSAGQFEPIYDNVTIQWTENESEVTQPVYTWEAEVTREYQVNEYRHYNNFNDNLKEREFARNNESLEERPRVENAGRAIVWEYQDCIYNEYWCDGSSETENRTYIGSEFDPSRSELDVNNETLALETAKPVEWHTTNETDTVRVKATREPNVSDRDLEWTKVSDEPVDNVTYELDKPRQVTYERTERVIVGFNVTNTTQEVTKPQTVHIATDSASNVNLSQPAANANKDAGFFGDRGANTAAGVGGTAGTTYDGVLTKGESIAIQLDRPLLFAGERVHVEIIDKETNSRVLDRTVRVDDPKQFRFTPTAINQTDVSRTEDGNISVRPPSVSIGNNSTSNLPDSPDQPDTSEVPGDGNDPIDDDPVSGDDPVDDSPNDSITPIDDNNLDNSETDRSDTTSDSLYQGVNQQQNSDNVAAETQQPLCPGVPMNQDGDCTPDPKWQENKKSSKKEEPDKPDIGPCDGGNGMLGIMMMSNTGCHAFAANERAGQFAQGLTGSAENPNKSPLHGDDGDLTFNPNVPRGDTTVKEAGETVGDAIDEAGDSAASIVGEYLGDDNDESSESDTTQAPEVDQDDRSSLREEKNDFTSDEDTSRSTSSDDDSSSANSRLQDVKDKITSNDDSGGSSSDYDSSSGSTESAESDYTNSSGNCGAVSCGKLAR